MKISSLLKQSAYTLLEVFVSMSLFSVGALAVAQAYTAQLAFNTNNEIRSGGIMAAQQVLDNLRVIDPTTLPTSGNATPQTIIVNGKTYIVTITYCRITSYCSSVNVRLLTATVTHHNKTVYSVDTAYAQLR